MYMIYNAYLYVNDIKKLPAMFLSIVSQSLCFYTHFYKKLTVET